LIQPPNTRRQANVSACTPLPSITASSTSLSNGAVSIGFQSMVKINHHKQTAVFDLDHLFGD